MIETFTATVKPLIILGQVQSQQVTFTIAPSNGGYVRSADCCFEVVATLIGESESYVALRPLACCSRFPYSRLAGIWKSAARGTALQLISYHDILIKLICILPMRNVNLCLICKTCLLVLMCPLKHARRSTAFDQRLLGMRREMETFCYCEVLCKIDPACTL